MKRTYTYKQNKRSIVTSILEGKYTVERAALIMRVQSATIKRWLTQFGRDVLSATTVANEQTSQPLFRDSQKTNQS